jgi:GT2 family glycosyltransferase
MEVIGRRILQWPEEALVLQCRDLPEGYDSDWVAAQGTDWDKFADIATLRPRWGMGGMMAVSRDTFLSIRGFDERMEIYGGEDLDFAQRVRWSGRRLSWLEDSGARMYHMWHPSTRVAVGATAEGQQAIDFNRDIMLNDKSIVRNVTAWRHPPPDAYPLASVVIATKNRSSFLVESIYSALAQSARDIEVIVVDDGSTDDTQAVVDAVEDPRVRYYRRNASGIASSRNFGASVARAAYIVIHDDDDLMFPDRIECHFAALQAGDSGTFGGWIDFSDEDGDAIESYRGKTFSLAMLLFTGRVFAHGTLMIETRLIRLIGYDTRIRSGSDFNLAIRLARLGICLRNTGQFHLARRMHSGQVTAVDAAHQSAAARRTSTLALSTIPEDRHAGLRADATKSHGLYPAISQPESAALIRPYLPDRLATRDVRVTLTPGQKLPEKHVLRSAFRWATVVDRLRDDSFVHVGVLYGATWSQLASLSAAGIPFTVLSSRLRGTGTTPPGGSLDARADPISVHSIASDLISLEKERADYLILTGKSNQLPVVDAPLAGDWEIIASESTRVTRAYRLQDGSSVKRMLPALLQHPEIDLQLHQVGVAPGSADYWQALAMLAS